eukprot:SAG11_NODE_413_length_9694_cov_2.695675_12_plen_63_part_00
MSSGAARRIRIHYGRSAPEKGGKEAKRLLKILEEEFGELIPVVAVRIPSLLAPALVFCMACC